jgi:hypothetical protein
MHIFQNGAIPFWILPFSDGSAAISSTLPKLPGAAFRNMPMDRARAKQHGRISRSYETILLLPSRIYLRSQGVF